MTPQTRGRTVITLFAVIIAIGVNTFYSVAFDDYSAWFAWAVVGIIVALLALVLRFQQRLTASSTLLILAVPIVVATAGAIIGV